jgi:hypothetical protein
VLLLALALVFQVQEIALPQDGDAPVRIVCPLKQTTRVVLPEALRQLKGVGRETEQLGLSVERTRPLALIVVRPETHPVSAQLEFRGHSRVIRLVFESAAEGESGEVHLVDASTRPPSVPPPVAAPPAGPAASPALDLDGLLAATPVAIDRREALPGQPGMVLVDALKGDKWIWLRFRLERGAAARVERASWEHGDIASFTQEAAGEDLRIVVQVPRARVTRKTRVSIKLLGGGQYRFALRPGTIPGLFRSLFQ